MLSFLLALVPIAVIIILMIGFRWGAARAGAAGYLSALLIALLFFGAGPRLLAYAHGRALLFSLDVLLIIWAAFLLYRVADEAGAIRTIGQALPHLTADRGMQALIIGWAFAAFLQGVGGFGVPVAVIAPILVGLGFTPLLAVVIPSIGHGWAVSFGSLGSSYQALMAVTGLSTEVLAAPAALLLSIACLATGYSVAHAAGGWVAVRRLALPVLIMGIVMGSVHLLVGISPVWNIAAFCAGMAGLLVAYPLARRWRNEHSSKSEEADNKKDGDILDRRALVVALSGYIILIVLTLGIQLITPISDFLGQVTFQVRFPEVSTATGYVTPEGFGRKITVFRHPGAILAYAAMLAYLIYRYFKRYTPGAARRILGGMVGRVMASSVSIVSMVTMAVVMENSGMTETLARGLADVMGRAYPLIAPWIGGLGAFMTGSNTNSNVIFGALQQRMAELLGFSVAVILAAQTAGAGLTSVLAPTKVVVGTSTAGMAGREGEVMRKLIVYTFLILLLASLLTVMILWVFP